MMKTRRASPILVIGGITIIIGFLWLISTRGSSKKSLLENFQSGSDSLSPPSMDSLMENPKIGPEEANTAMKNVLMYIENNPTDTDEFLQFVKGNFFTTGAQFKSPMDFKGLSSKWSSQFKSKK
jgi:hypothetical protein